MFVAVFWSILDRKCTIYWIAMAGVAYYSTLFTGQLYDGQICGRNRKYNLVKLTFF